MQRFILKLIAILMLVLLPGGCGKPSGYPELRDLQRLPQDLTAYISPGRQKTRLLPAARQQRLSNDFRRRFLAPWQPTWNGRPAEELFGNRTWLLEETLYGGNRRILPMRVRRQWLARCAMDSFPNADYPAITLRSGNLRGLPTRQPAFRDFGLPGEGYPFDYLQHSSISAGTPVRVCQRSSGGCWLLVETDGMFGWLPATDVAAVDTRTMDRFTTSKWCVSVKDDVPLVDGNGAVLAIAGLGSVWAQAEFGKVLVPERGDGGNARLRAALVAAPAIRDFPLALTPANMAETGNRLLGTPYDWGGQLGERDCSATLRDLFACFGIYLPRNSAAQAASGKSLDLLALTAKERKTAIVKQAQPWLTMAYMPGHIMLYVGQFNGQPVFLHTLWGLKTEDLFGREGRYLVGRTVLTGLRAGDELRNVKRPEGLLVERIEKLVLLGNPEGGTGYRPD